VAPGEALLREGPPLGSGAGANHGAFIIAAVWEEEVADGGGRFEEEAAGRFEEEADGGGEGSHRRRGSTRAGAEIGRPDLRKQIHAGGGRRGHRRSGSTPAPTTLTPKKKEGSSCSPPGRRATDCV
jgi:hypothetical protein